MLTVLERQHSNFTRSASASLSMRVRVPLHRVNIGYVSVGMSKRSVVKRARLGLVIVGFGLLPTQIGLQDLGSLIAPSAAASDFAQGRVIASPFGTIHAPLV